MREPIMSYNVAQLLAGGIMARIDTIKERISHYDDPEIPVYIKPSVTTIQEDYEAIKEGIEFYEHHAILPDLAAELLKEQFRQVDKQLNARLYRST